MNIEDLILGDGEASKLTKIDELVEVGLSRHRAEKLVNKFYSLIDGPFKTLLHDKALRPERYHDDPEQYAERVLLETFLVSFLNQWATDRLTIAAVKQSFAFRYLASIDKDPS